MSTHMYKYPLTAQPTARQLAFQDWEFGLFIHFGIETFAGHNGIETNYDPPPPAHLFNPTDPDPRAWIEPAVAAGMRYAIFTAKHHNGCCLWQTRTTDYSIAASLKVGLYYSPWDKHCPFYDDAPAYDEYMIAHMRELLGDYGPIDLLWLDGFGSEHHVYDWPRIMGEVRRLQPEIAVFNMGDPDYRWVGNEAGVADLPNWNTVEAIPFAMSAAEQMTAVAQPVWLPAECDAMMRFGSWFYVGYDVETVKSVDELIGIYYYSVGRGANLLLNISPEPSGRFPEPDRLRLLEFGREIRRRFDSPLATLEDGALSASGWQYQFDRPTLVNHVVVQEDLRQGEHIRAYRIVIQPTHGAHRITVYEGRSIGHKAIAMFPTVAARALMIEITEASGPFTLRNVQVHHLVSG